MRNRRLAVGIGFLVLFVAAGCTSSGGDTAGDNDGGGATAEYLLCTEPAGSWTDLTGEDESWRDQPSINWTDDSGCAIRLDHVWHNFGDDHCDWERVEHISFGLPVGTPYTGQDADPPGQDWEPFFIFNTDGAVGSLPVGQQIDAADVPATAIDTGLQTVTGRSLFIAEDETALYEVQDNTARVFIRIPEDQYGCA